MGAAIVGSISTVWSTTLRWSFTWDAIEVWVLAGGCYYSPEISVAASIASCVLSRTGGFLASFTKRWRSISLESGTLRSLIDMIDSGSAVSGNTTEPTRIKECILKLF